MGPASKILILILGGSAGTLCRYVLSEWAQGRFGTYFPYGTLMANLIGCLILGCLLGFFEARYQALTLAPPHLRLLLVTGFLGALTTFSSYELEALLFLRQGLWERALLYLISSVALGLAVLFLSFRAVKLVYQSLG